MKIIKKIISSVLALTITAVPLVGYAASIDDQTSVNEPASAASSINGIWDGSSDTSWYNSDESSFEISTAEQLAGLAKLVREGDHMEGKNITLTSDIVLNDTSNFENWDTQPPKNLWIPIGVVPMGSDVNSTLISYNTDYTSFEGVFDGGGHTIEGMYTIHDNFAGLFAYAYQAGIFRVIIKDSYVEAVKREDQTVWEPIAGGIAAVSQNTVINECEFDGKVFSKKYAGGIAGKLEGSEDSNFNYDDALLNDGNGGIIKKASVYNCITRGKIAANAEEGEIAFSEYVKDEGVEADVAAGGIVGYLYAASIPHPATNCASFGIVKSVGGVAGGIIGTNGNNNGFNMTNCYYSGYNDIYSGIGRLNQSGIDTEAINYTKENLTKPELADKLGTAFVLDNNDVFLSCDLNKTPATYRIEYKLFGGRFNAPIKESYNVNTETFTIAEPVRDGYEFVGWSKRNGDAFEKNVTIERGTSENFKFYAIWKASESKAVWDGSENTDWYDPEETILCICSAEELAGLSKLVREGNKMEYRSIYLTSDIVLNDTTDYDNWDSQPPRNNWIPIGVVPIGTKETKTFTNFEADCTTFQGIFNGNGHTITGLYAYHDNLAGLFADVAYGVVANLRITKGYVKVYRRDDVSWDAIAGGIVAKSKCSIINQCEFDGKVISDAGKVDSLHGVHSCYAGGIVGFWYPNTDKFLAFLFGHFIGLITNFEPYAAIAFLNGIEYEGMANPGIYNCISRGEVYAHELNQASGGILGYGNSEGVLLNCLSLCKVGPEDSSGGMIGETQNFNAYNCFYTNAENAIGKCTGGAEIDAKNITKENLSNAQVTELLGKSFVCENDEIHIVCFDYTKIADTDTDTDQKIEVPMGDINLDDKVDTLDAVLVLRHLSHLEEFTDERIRLADVNHDDAVDTADAVLILRACSNLEDLGTVTVTEK